MESITAQDRAEAQARLDAKRAARRYETYDVTGNIIAFEGGELDQEETVELFQHLVDSGLAWQLQGFYGRYAQNLIEAGLITR